MIQEDGAPPEAVKEDPFAPMNRPSVYRTRVIAASVNADEEEGVLRALANGGFPNKSAGARVVLMAYKLDEATRDAVAAAVKQYGIE